MSRLRSNCSEMRVKPRKLVEVISFSPAMRPNWRSRGVATAEAMISVLAPGKAACTSRVGNSTWGSGEIGKNWYAIRPARASAMVSSAVPIGRWMNRAEKFMRSPHARRVSTHANRDRAERVTLLTESPGRSARQPAHSKDFEWEYAQGTSDHGLWARHSTQSPGEAYDRQGHCHR